MICCYLHTHTHTRASERAGRGNITCIPPRSRALPSLRYVLLRTTFRVRTSCTSIPRHQSQVICLHFGEMRLQTRQKLHILINSGQSEQTCSNAHRQSGRLLLLLFLCTRHMVHPLVFQLGVMLSQFVGDISAAGKLHVS